MKEYKGISVNKYSQAESKLMVLFPVFDKFIPKAKEDGSFLDLGCGLGDYSQYALPKGYKYLGIDNSEDMIKRARLLYPDLNFIVADSRDFSNVTQEKHDIILISMVFITMNKRKDIEKTLIECKKVLKPEGKIIIGDGHPAFDPYMQKHFIGRDDIEGEWKGYFESGIKFVVHKKLATGDFYFEDHHFTLKDYIDSINNSGLKLSGINECQPQKELRYKDPKYYDRNKYHPTYIVYECSHA